MQMPETIAEAFLAMFHLLLPPSIQWIRTAQADFASFQ